MLLIFLEFTNFTFQAGHVSARSSFSARFFSQSNHTLPVLSLFQESPEVDTKQMTEVRATSEVVTVEDQEPQRVGIICTDYIFS